MLQSRITFTYGLALNLGLVLAGSAMLSPLSALAAPDPIFAPMLEEISASALANNPLRLPAVVPTDVELYPFVIETDTVIMLRLDTAPNCTADDCLWHRDCNNPCRKPQLAPHKG